MTKKDGGTYEHRNFVIREFYGKWRISMVSNLIFDSPTAAKRYIDKKYPAAR